MTGVQTCALPISFDIRGCLYPPILDYLPGIHGLQCANICIDLNGNEDTLITCDYQCYSHSDCGENEYVGLQFCQGGNVVQNYRTQDCSSWSCSTNTFPQIIEYCTDGCTDGNCNVFMDPACDSIGEVVQFDGRSEEHTSELQSHSFISYAVFCLKKKNPMR